MKDIVLFGTGSGLRRYIALLNTIGLYPKYLCDNNSKKWNTYICGYKVIQPESLKDLDCEIIISSTYEQEIRKQLYEMGQGSKLSTINFNEELKKYVDKNYEEIWKPKLEMDSQCEETNTVIFDAFDGVGWGGMEIWSYEVGLSLKKRGYKVLIYGSEEQKKAANMYESLIFRFLLDRDYYWKTVCNVLDDMEKRLPVKIVNNWTDHVFIAAYILKKYYPDKVQIYTVVHNDILTLYDKQVVWQDSMIRIAAVSQKIAETLEAKMRIPSHKICYKENFIPQNDVQYENFRSLGEPIKIGWGARVEVKQKRADRLIQLVKALDDLHVNYLLNIAGDGSYLPRIEEELSNSISMGKVVIHGEIPSDEMKKFWMNNNIYINLSDFEGTSLAMLEAMAYGNVPVVTDVSGVREFVTHEENGFYYTLGDICEMAKAIFELSKNEQLRRKMSNKCSEIVKAKCDINDYARYIAEDFIQGDLEWR